MVTTRTGLDRTAGWGTSSSVVGGLVGAALGLVHLYGLGVSGWTGIALLFVVWPIVGGIVAAVGVGGLVHERPLAGALAGTYGAIVVSVVVLLASWAGVRSAFILSNVGVTLWPVFFATALTTLLSWTVFGFVAGYATARPN